MKKQQKKYHISLVILFCIIAIFAGKFVRHTVMKETLVMPGIGWHMVDKVNNNSYNFGLAIKETGNKEELSRAASNSGFIFQNINFLHLADTYYGYEILISIIWNILILLIIIKLKKSYNFFELLFIVASVSVLNIFDFALAKEPIQMLYFVLMYLVLRSKRDSDKKKFIKCFLLYLLCLLTFRNYYIIMAFYFVFIYFLYKLFMSKAKKISYKHIVFGLILVFISYFMILNVAKIVSVSNFNELLRVRLRTSEAVSDIRTVFNSTNLLVFTLDYVFVIIRLLLPFELLLLGPKYIVYILYQVAITYIILKNVKSINQYPPRRQIAIFIYIAFLLGSATFEPDFGSWIRHEAVLFPIFMLICGFDEVEKKEHDQNEG